MKGIKSMQPYQLTGVSPDGRQGHVWACGVCLRTCLDEDHAKRCCSCSVCGKVVEIDKHNRRPAAHDGCLKAVKHKNRAERFAKAAKLEAWDGGVFWGDEYYPGLEDAIEAINENCEPEDRPEWLEVAKPIGPRKVDPDWVIETVYDDIACEDDVYAYLKGVDEFRAACQAFSELNKEMEWYEADWKRLVRVPPEPEE